MLKVANSVIDASRITGVVPAANGGTGIANNAAMTVTGSGNFAYTRTLTAATNVTFPTTGTLITLAGVETLTNKTLTTPTINNIKLGYTTTATAAGTTTLVLASTHQQYFTGTLAQTIALPVVTTLVLGISYSIENNSTGTLTVQSSGLNTISTIPPGITALYTCVLITGTTAASWDFVYTGFATLTGTGNLVLSAAPTLSGDVNLSTGNLVIGTAGKGIDFSITTHPAGMTSELLADYEEGTWTPTDGSGDSLSFTVYNPTYTKIGRLVQIEASILWPSTVSVAAVKISGLPFTAAGGDDNTAGMFMPGTNVGVAAANYLWQVSRGQSSILGSTNSNTDITNANMSGKFVKLCGMYHV